MIHNILLPKLSAFSEYRVTAVIAIALTLSACAIVEDIRSDGTYQRSIALATPLVVAPVPTGQSSVVRITGLGFGDAGNTAAVGWYDETVATLGPDCRVVLIGNTDQQLERFATLLPKKEAICSDSKLNGGQK
jgi:hypothetical protein